MYTHSDMWQPIHFQIVVQSCLPTYNGYVQNRQRNVIDELILFECMDVNREIHGKPTLERFTFINIDIYQNQMWYT